LKIIKDRLGNKPHDEYQINKDEEKKITMSRLKSLLTGDDPTDSDLRKAAKL